MTQILRTVTQVRVECHRSTGERCVAISGGERLSEKTLIPTSRSYIGAVLKDETHMQIGRVILGKKQHITFEGLSGIY